MLRGFELGAVFGRLDRIDPAFMGSYPLSFHPQGTRQTFSSEPLGDSLADAWNRSVRLVEIAMVMQKSAVMAMAADHYRR